MVHDLLDLLSKTQYGSKMLPMCPVLTVKFSNKQLKLH